MGDAPTAKRNAVVTAVLDQGCGSGFSLVGSLGFLRIFRIYIYICIYIYTCYYYFYFVFLRALRVFRALRLFRAFRIVEGV